MSRFFATCARGLEPILAQELTNLKAREIAPGLGGVHFSGGVEMLYKANLWLRTAVRVLEPVLEAEVRNPDELYDAVRTIPWDRYLTPDHTIAVDCNVKNSGITHSQYAARRVKDAICDQFRDRCGLRPSVDVEHPAIGLNLHISRDRAILSFDTSWDSLHKRGYRPIQTRAPLNEALAAGLLLHLGYDGTKPLVDPMCGSGTFPIEAAWIALKRPPGLTRKWFAFYGRHDFDRALWNAIREDARKKMLAHLPAPIFASDIRRDAVNLATDNAAAAGIGHLLKFVTMDVYDAKPPTEVPGLMIVNPPYGERLGEEEELVGLYAALGDTFKRFWPTWELCLFTPSEFLAKKVKLAAYKKTPFYNGAIPCKLRQYLVNPPEEPAAVPALETAISVP